MKLADLPATIIEQIRTFSYDRIVGKHEGPERWDDEFKFGGDPELMQIDGRNVLLPLDRDQHPNITILRSIISADGNTLTLFLKDTTHTSPEHEWLDAGRVAICEKLKDVDVYVATFYHEWFIIENEGLARS